MDWLTFISNLVRDLAWPLVALVVLAAVLFRGASFVRFVRSFKWKDFEITMRENFDEARAGAEQVKLELEHQPTPDINPKDEIIKLAEIDTGLAVLEIWKKIEAELVKLIQHNGLMGFTKPDKFILDLAKKGKLSKDDVSLYRNLREIRNQAVHSGEKSALTTAEVVEFRDLVDVLVAKLEQMQREPGYIDILMPKEHR